ncbi:type 1 periplasmic-binding domain-containing protein [Streptomyces shenzhenensis]|uniref:hypothetical protein n=1 Tax=Streptomyces shenzhenensis TaxID=943815 RepID=UPI0015F0F344|nr:hypothetical protein [Streptomyces shenzhenensis]
MGSRPDRDVGPGTNRFRAAGLPLSAHRVRHWHRHGRRPRAAVELLSGTDRPTAIFAVNDLAMIGTVGAARRACG